MREAGLGENALVSREREQMRSPLYTRGLALFALGPNFWDKPSITPSDVDSRMQHVWPVEVYRQFAVVDAISNEQRGDHIPTREEVRTWIESDMPAFFQDLREMTSPHMQGIKGVLKKNFHIDVDRGGSYEDILGYFQGKSAWLWRTFFTDGQSNTGEFVRTLTRDVLWTNKEDYDRRIVLARPLFGLFGGEETAILLEHAALAYDHVYDHEKSDFTAWIKRGVQIPFSSPAEEHAYRLAAEKIIALPNEPNWRLRRRGDVTPQPVQKAPPGQPIQMPGPGGAPPSPQEPTEPATQPVSSGEMGTRGFSTPSGKVYPRRAGAPTAPRTESAPQSPAEAQTAIEQEAKQQYVTAHEIAASPSHPKFSADRTLALPLAGGESVLVSAIDGIGSGEKYSEEPAGIMVRALQEEMGKIDHMPTIREGAVALAKAYYVSATKIEDYKENLKSKRVWERVREQVGTVGASALVCREKDRDVLVALNLGDSRVYVFNPQTQELRQVTQDHNVPQLLLRSGSLSPQEAFLDHRRNNVYKSVTVSSVADTLMHLLSGERSDDYTVVPLPATPHVIFATTDGWTDNTPPEWEKEKVIHAYEQAVKGGTFNPRAFTHDLLEGARDTMREHKEMVIQGTPPYTVGDFAKPDDVGIAVAYRPART